MRIIILLLIFNSTIILSQKYEYTYLDKDSTSNCYLTIFPNNKEVKGVIIRDYSSLPDAESKAPYPYKWRDLALSNGLAIVYVVSSNFFPELFYDDNKVKVLDRVINNAITKYNFPIDNIFIGGMSSSGTRAIRYVQYCEKGLSEFGIKIKGVFAVDSPLDFERFYNSTVHHKKYLTDGLLWEANILPEIFEKYYGGSAEKNAKNYREYSPFSYLDSTGANAKYLLNTPIIFFHEPDIDWWSNERGASYFDINSYDIAGLYVFLMKNGHKDVELITSSGKGFNRKGERNCHSWSIVDEDYLISWILKRVD